MAETTLKNIQDTLVKANEKTLDEQSIQTAAVEVMDENIQDRLDKSIGKQENTTDAIDNLHETFSKFFSLEKGRVLDEEEARRESTKKDKAAAASALKGKNVQSKQQTAPDISGGFSFKDMTGDLANNMVALLGLQAVVARLKPTLNLASGVLGGLVNVMSKGFLSLSKVKFLGPIAKASGVLSEAFGRIGVRLSGFAGKFSGIFGKLFWPITVLLGAVGGVKASYDEWRKGGSAADIVTAAWTGVLDALVLSVINLGKDALAWALNSIGWDNAATTLNEFDLTGWAKKEIGLVVDDFFTIFGNIKDLISGEFSWEKLEESLLILLKRFTPFGAIYNFVERSVEWLQDVFGFGDPDTEFNLSTFIGSLANKLGNWISELFTKLLSRLKSIPVVGDWFLTDQEKIDVKRRNVVEKELAEAIDRQERHNPNTQGKIDKAKETIDATNEALRILQKQLEQASELELSAATGPFRLKSQERIWLDEIKKLEDRIELKTNQVESSTNTLNTRNERVEKLMAENAKLNARLKHLSESADDASGNVFAQDNSDHRNIVITNNTSYAAGSPIPISNTLYSN